MAPDIWTECFDFTQAPLPPGTYTMDPPQILSLNWGAGIHDQVSQPTGVFEGLLERILILPELKALDGRGSVFDTLNALEDSVITLKRML